MSLVKWPDEYVPDVSLLDLGPEITFAQLKQNSSKNPNHRQWESKFKVAPKLKTVEVELRKQVGTANILIIVFEPRQDRFGGIIDFKISMNSSSIMGMDEMEEMQLAIKEAIIVRKYVKRNLGL